MPGVLVIGAGQAGLAASYWLRHYGFEHVIVDGGGRFGDPWRARWDSLEMITPNWMNSLPGMAYPGDADGFSPKATTIGYLQDYGEWLEAPVRWHTRVTELSPTETGFTASTAHGEMDARAVIVATGHYHLPRIPRFAADAAGAFQVHTSEYKNPSQIPDGGVLVVGSGNSGVSIAIELAKDHDVTLACGDNPRVPRRVTGAQLVQTMGAIAAQELAIPDDGRDREADLMRWLDDVGFYEMAADTPLGRQLAKATSDAYCGPPLTEVAEAHGITLTGRLESIVDTPNTIVWATGYTHDFGWIRADVTQHHRGVTTIPGLYLLGLRFMHTASSSLLYGVGRDAQHIVEHLSRRLRP